MKHLAKAENDKPTASHAPRAGRRSLRQTGSLLLWLALASQLSGLGADPLDQWVWRNPLPSGNSPFRISFANGAFWGVNGGTLTTSPDGTNWTSRGLPPVDDAGTVGCLCRIS